MKLGSRLDSWSETSAMELPKKYKFIEVQDKWKKQWDEEKTFQYDPQVERSNTFVVDTPPPTVSGSLHVGHVFSYTQTDILVRYQRMKGKNIFYPIGYDDNGLPTERRVQNLYRVKCNPHLSYDDSLKVQAKEPKKNERIEFKEVSRKNFLEVCDEQTKEDRKNYRALWETLGLSVDWEQDYSTIGKHCRQVSQLSFRDLFEKGYVYSAVEPVLWDTSFQTAIAQAEIEDREKQGHYHDISFKVFDSDEYFVISTTRPELLAACIAVVAHPDDTRYQKYFGGYAETPLFHAKVPIMPSDHADPEKGTGILMVCTFGDVADVEFWKKSKLPMKQIISNDGKILPVTYGEAPFHSENVEVAKKYYSEISGLFTKQARAKMVELLKSFDSSWNKGQGALVAEPKPTQQFVKFYEKGDFPLELVPTRQWFVNILDFQKEFLQKGKEVNWYPPHMYTRLEQWVNGLNQNWCISRQRYFGVPIPVWYKIDDQGQILWDSPIHPAKETYPIDPMEDVPPGFSAEQRGKPGGFCGDENVMDTWATSSMTPQISSHWGLDETRHQKLFPADLRPQAHEIIRTWAFYTIVKSWMHEKSIPWKNIAISGWVVNPDKSKMSKSKGNTVTPPELIEEYSSDALRYWAGRAKLGMDTVYDEDVFKLGQRLTTKLFNVAKFVHLQFEDCVADIEKMSLKDVTHPLDQSWLKLMQEAVSPLDLQFNTYNYHKVLMDAESLFWDFCDNYVELVKARAYQKKDSSDGKSAIFTLQFSLNVFLRLFAPFTPFVCEEIWSWYFAGKEKTSIHRASWPVEKEFSAIAQKTEASYELSKAVINKVRATKTKEQKSLKWPLAALSVKAAGEFEKQLNEGREDLCLASTLEPEKLKFIADSSLTEISQLEIQVELAKEDKSV